MTAIAEIVVGDQPDRWQALGFTVVDGTCQIGTVRLRLVPAAGPGISGWCLAGVPDESVDDVDGLPTALGEPSSPAGSTHHNGAKRIDHVVVMTPDVGRTVRAVEQRLGLPLKRTREGQSMNRPVLQAFFRMGEVVLEVVGPPEGDPHGGPARFWGLALVVASLDTSATVLGDQVGSARQAVQRGQRIATVRSSAGLTVPLALMDADPTV
jgi:hypothetical protein